MHVHHVRRKYVNTILVVDCLKGVANTKVLFTSEEDRWKHWSSSTDHMRHEASSKYEDFQSNP